VVIPSGELISTIFEGQKIQKEKRAPLKLAEKIFFNGNCPSSNFFTNTRLGSQLCPFSGKEEPNLVDPLE
jgi:hypothetical protein